MSEDIELSIQLTHCDGLGIQHVSVRRFKRRSSW